MPKFTCSLMILLLILTPVMSGDGDSKTNPIFHSMNQVIDFANIDVDDVNQALESIIADCDHRRQKIYGIPDSERSFKNTLEAWDDLVNAFTKVITVYYLLANTSPDEAIRNACFQSIQKMTIYATGLEMDESYYKAVQTYEKTAEAKQLKGYQKKFLKDQKLTFKSNGLHLSAEKRAELGELKVKISENANQFRRNLAEDNGFIIMQEADLEGLDDAYKKARKQEDGSYKIDLSYPSYRAFMRYAVSDAQRKALYMKFTNRASDKNPKLLKETLVLRKKMAQLLGFDTFADYRLSQKMAATSKNVLEFENGLVESLMPKAKAEYAELLEVKRNHLDKADAAHINRWESAYYGNLLLKEKYQLDSQEVEQYFELDTVLDGLFKITQNLMGVRFVELKDASVWHPDVRLFNVLDGNNTIARFYLDLHPRLNKYGHAACFPIIPGKQTANGYQIPTAALVCNFPQATDDKPALMAHSQVETFFHEFGHVLHNTLTTANLSMQSGTNVAQDFVEAPSQIFENWAWNYEALQLFARHHRTKELLPKNLFQRMKKAQNVSSGQGNLYQVFLGLLDMTYHGDYDPESNKDTTQVVKELDRRIFLSPYVEGTYFESTFAHLMGYEAGYYGYLWSEVYAQDMFSIFARDGVLNEEVGRRYRDIILARGSSVEPLDLVKEFLGREPNDKAFTRSLGL